MLGLQYFSFEELWSPMVFLLYGSACHRLFLSCGPWREKHVPQDAKVTVCRRRCSLSGMVLYYMAQGGPFELLGHLMFTFHMVNMSISYLIVPPLLLLGIPAFMWRSCFRASFLDEAHVGDASDLYARAVQYAVLDLSSTGRS